MAKKKYTKRGTGDFIQTRIVGKKDIGIANDVLEHISEGYKKKDYLDVVHYLLEAFDEDRITDKRFV